MSQYNKKLNERRDASMKELGLMQTQNGDQDRDSIASSTAQPLTRSSSTSSISPPLSEAGGEGSFDSDDELQAASAECTKFIVAVNSMLQNNNIKGIEPAKPIPLPRKSLPEQANNDAIDLSRQEATSLQNSSEAAKARTRRDRSSNHSSEEIPTVTDRIKSLKKEGLDIHQ